MKRLLYYSAKQHQLGGAIMLRMKDGTVHLYTEMMDRPIVDKRFDDVQLVAEIEDGDTDIWISPRTRNGLIRWEDLL